MRSDFNPECYHGFPNPSHKDAALDTNSKAVQGKQPVALRFTTHTPSDDETLTIRYTVYNFAFEDTMWMA